MLPRSLTADVLLAHGEAPPLAHRRLDVTDCRITAITTANGPPRAAGRRLVMPALANAHDHARTVRPSSMGGLEAPLESWLFHLALVPAIDASLAARVSFGRTAMGGVGAVMAHYTRIQGLTDYVTEAGQVIAAAREVGVRIAFAVQCRDRNPIVYGPGDPILAALQPSARAAVEKRFMRPPLPAAEQVALVEAVAAAHEGNGATVQYGPAAVQWCSPALLSLIAERSAATGRRVHMHLLETKYQRAWADREFPNGIVRYLDDIGLLSPRLSLAHCVWARDDELALIAERGVTIAVNTSSNLALRSGLAALPRMLAQGCRVAMGLDGMAFDEDEDALRELRINYAVAKGTGFDVTMPAATALRFATTNGRFVIDGCDTGGMLAEGRDADILALDLDALEADKLEPDVPALSLLLARARKAHVTDLVVAGRDVVSQGKLAAFDLAAAEHEMMSRLRAALPETEDLRQALPQFAAALAAHHRDTCGCT